MSIHADTSLGAVHLTVQNLARSAAFYETSLGLKLRGLAGSKAQFGVKGRELLVLTEDPQARPYARTTGLYHFALKVPSRLELARALRRIVDSETAVQGFADHLVSEAIYLPDPDGNGIEIYRDRPREQWQYENGRLKMGTDPLDLENLLGELNRQPDDASGIHPETTMGHMHLHVSQLEPAEAFYREVLGFDLVLRYGPSASFLAAGGYHHHIGLNTWAGVGAPPPPLHSSGLRYFVIELPDDKALQEVARRITQNDVELAKTSRGLLVRDPSANGILLTSKNGS